VPTTSQKATAVRRAAAILEGHFKTLAKNEEIKARKKLQKLAKTGYRR